MGAPGDELPSTRTSMAISSVYDKVEGVKGSVDENEGKVDIDIEKRSIQSNLSIPSGLIIPEPAHQRLSKDGSLRHRRLDHPSRLSDEGEDRRVHEYDFGNLVRREHESRDYGPPRRVSTSLTMLTAREARPHKPFRMPPNQGPGPWLNEADRATALLSLFFDVVVVAVLSAFSATHEIQTPSVIPVFLSYYIVITWIWTSQVHYDVRYEAEDTFHRIAKCLQIMVFVYMGAASGGWSPGNILQPEFSKGLTESAEVLHSRAAESFLTVTIAFIIYRGMLMFQYALVIFTGRRTKNSTKGAQISVVTLIISSIISIIAVAVPAHSNAVASTKIALFYLAIAVELAGAWAQMGTGMMGPVSSDYLMDRFAALSLIILGEGFVNLTKAFSKAITGLNVSDVASYAQVFLVILVMYNIWSFLFSEFPKSAMFNVKRMVAWEFIHFPLHFGILLLMAAMVNVITFDTFAVGLYKASDAFGVVMAALNTSTPLSPSELRHVSVYLNRLDIVPTFMPAYKELNDTFAENKTEGLTMANQYFIQILYGVASESGLVISDSVKDQINEMLESDPADLDVTAPTSNTTSDFLSVNSVYPTNTTADAAADHSTLAFQKLIVTTLNDSLLGIAWLYPTAGGVLILCAIRSLIRFKVMTLEKQLIYGLQITAGVGLGLLGFLNLGSQKIFLQRDVNINESVLAGGNDMVDIVGRNWAIAVVVLVYSFVNIFGHGIAWFFRKRRSRTTTTRGLAPVTSAAPLEMETLAVRS